MISMDRSGWVGCSVVTWGLTRWWKRRHICSICRGHPARHCWSSKCRSYKEKTENSMFTNRDHLGKEERGEKRHGLICKRKCMLTRYKKKKKKTHLCPTAIEAILLLIKTLRCPAFGAERKQLPLLARDSLAWVPAMGWKGFRISQTHHSFWF